MCIVGTLRDFESYTLLINIIHPNSAISIGIRIINLKPKNQITMNYALSIMNYFKSLDFSGLSVIIKLVIIQKNRILIEVRHQMSNTDRGSHLPFAGRCKRLSRRSICLNMAGQMSGHAVNSRMTVIMRDGVLSTSINLPGSLGGLSAVNIITHR